MGSELDHARLMADRIARRVSSQPVVAPASNAGEISSELAAMRASLNELQNKLVQIESKLRSGNAG
jgi:hypothetical protein